MILFVDSGFYCLILSNLRSQAYMWQIFKKDFTHFFSSVAGYLVLILFTLVMGLMLFVFQEYNIPDSGYADLNPFFDLAPWVMFFLTSAVSMRTFSEETRNGTMDLLKSLPLSVRQLAIGKFLFVLVTVIISLIPSVFYIITIKYFSSNGLIDWGGLVGSYIGLLLMCGSFSAIGVYCSTITQNIIASFFFSLTACLLLYYGFHALSQLTLFRGGADYYLEMAGIDYHYRSMSRGVIDSRDALYCISLITLFLYFTIQKLKAVRR